MRQAAGLSLGEGVSPSCERGVRHMSDLEILSLVLMMLAIIVPLLVFYINYTKKMTAHAEP